MRDVWRRTLLRPSFSSGCAGRASVASHAGRALSTQRNPAGLTNREVELLALVAEGLSNPEIAMRLSISAKTVDHHVSSAMGKLGAHSRAQAVASAYRLGALAPAAERDAK